MNAVAFEKKTKSMKIRNQGYLVTDIALKVGNRYFDPVKTDEKARRIQQRIHKRYWETIKAYYLQGHSLIVKLSGLHFSIDEVKDYMFTRDSRTNMILRYAEWDIDKRVHLEDTYALIECDKRLFRKLFDKFWFALGFELSFEGVVLKADKVSALEKWSRREDSSRKYNDLIAMSSILFDNLTNGFHFRVIAPEKNMRLVNTGLVQECKEAK